MKTYIYKIENKINGKVYIGKSENPDQRWKAHVKSSLTESDLLIHRAIRKYGIDAFVFSILNEIEGDGCILEEEIISQFNCCVLDHPENGYNMTRGGDGFTSEETSYYLNIRTEEGRNPFSKGGESYDIAIENNKKRVSAGTHNFQTEKHKRIVSTTQNKLVEEGKHHLQGEKGSEKSKAVQKKRIENGTFHMLQPGMKEHQRKKALEQLENGTHNSQIEHTCPHCQKIGKGPMMMRWHFERCKNAPK